MSHRILAATLSLLPAFAPWTGAAAKSSEPKAAAAPAPSVWTIDASHSSVTFSVRHMMITDVRGEFGSVAGEITIDEGDLARSKVEATVDPATVNTREPKRDKHLRSADFFDVEKHKEARFVSSRVEPAGDKRLRVSGDLTLRGVTRPVTMEVTYTDPIRDSRGTTKRGAKATTTIKRADWGLTWNKALESGGVLVSDEVALTLDLELNRK